MTGRRRNTVKSLTMKKLLDMKTIGAAAVFVVLALWLGYYLGYHNGVQQERRAWLATEQTFPDPKQTVVAGRPAIQTSRWPRTFYRNPYVGGTILVRSGPVPVNRPDPRDTPIR